MQTQGQWWGCQFGFTGKVIVYHTPSKQGRRSGVFSWSGPGMCKGPGAGGHRTKRPGNCRWLIWGRWKGDGVRERMVREALGAPGCSKEGALDSEWGSSHWGVTPRVGMTQAERTMLAALWGRGCRSRWLGAKVQKDAVWWVAQTLYLFLMQSVYNALINSHFKTILHRF